MLLKKKLSSSITTAGLDEMYTYAIRSGATGGKLLGAGGGGFFLFYVEEEKRNFFKQKMDKFIEIPFQFEDVGTKVMNIS